MRSRTACGFAAHIEAEDLGAASVALQDRGEDPHGGRLARPVRAEQAEHAAGRNREVDAVDGDNRSEPLLEVLDDDGVVHGLTPLHIYLNDVKYPRHSIVEELEVFTRSSYAAHVTTSGNGPAPPGEDAATEAWRLMTAVMMARKQQFPQIAASFKLNPGAPARAPHARSRPAAVDEHPGRRVGLRRLQCHVAGRPTRGARPRRAARASHRSEGADGRAHAEGRQGAHAGRVDDLRGARFDRRARPRRSRDVVSRRCARPLPPTRPGSPARGSSPA